MLEILPGEEGLNLDNPIAIACQIKPDTSDKLLAMSSKDIDVALAGSFEDIDLYYMDSVLCSTGWNNNDEVFLAEEMWKAKNSPKDKPLNVLHTPRVVVGHIIGSYAVAFDNNEIIPNDTESIPNDFNIITKSVIYKALGLNIDNKYNEEITNLIKEIKDGDWYVSMECIFAGFDYALLGKDGEQKIIKRDKNSAFLTKSLRAYGGDGIYDGWKIGRLPRDFVFSGHGLVKNPANKKSVILSQISAFRGINTDVGLILSENKMSKEIEDKNEALVKENTTLKAELAVANDAKKSIEVELATANTSLKTVTDEKTVAIASVDGTKAALEIVQTELSTVKADLIVATERADKAENELNTIKANTLKELRLSQIKANSVLSDEEIKEIEEDLISMSESSFNALIKVATKAKVENTKADVTEVEDEVKTATSEIDNVEVDDTSATATASTASEVATLGVALAEMLEKSMKPNKKVKGGK